MALVTWLSVLILGPGSLAIFLWFLLDLKRVFSEAESTRDDADAA